MRFVSSAFLLLTSLLLHVLEKRRAIDLKRQWRSQVGRGVMWSLGSCACANPRHVRRLWEDTGRMMAGTAARLCHWRRAELLTGDEATVASLMWRVAGGAVWVSHLIDSGNNLFSTVYGENTTPTCTNAKSRRDQCPWRPTRVLSSWLKRLWRHWTHAWNAAVQWLIHFYEYHLFRVGGPDWKA